MQKTWSRIEYVRGWTSEDEWARLGSSEVACDCRWAAGLMGRASGLAWWWYQARKFESSPKPLQGVPVMTKHPASVQTAVSVYPLGFCVTY